MAVDLKNNFKGGLDLDTSLLLLGRNKYIDALNITRDAIDGNQDGNITNIVSNRLVNNIYLNSFYNNANLNLFLVVYNNGDGTQTARATFDTITVVATILQYYDGTNWIDIVSGGGSGRLSGTLPDGNWQYRLYVLYSTSPDNFQYYNFSSLATRYITIGSYANTLRNTIVFFEYNSFNYHSIFEYNHTTRVIIPIFRNLIDSNFIDILNFTATGKIINVNIYNRDEGDLLFFLDSLGRPTGMDIALFKAGTYTPVTRDIIDVAKCPPLSPPMSIYGNDATKPSNSLTNKLFRFMQVWVYDNNETSTPSPIGAIPLPVKILDITYTNVITNNNLINISLNSGDKQVKAVEIWMSYINKSNTWSEWVIVTRYNKAANSIPDDSIFNFPFYNDSTYSPVNPLDATDTQDYVPIRATAQEMPNGNVLAYAGIYEGLSRDITPNVVNTVNTYAAGTGQEGNLTAVTSNFGGGHVDTYRYGTIFSGVPYVGTVITLKVRKRSDSTLVTGATYTTVQGDTITSILNALLASALGIGIFQFVAISNDNTGIFYEFDSAVYFDEVVTTIVSTAVGANVDSIPTFKFSTNKEIAIQYKDKKGRTNGVLYNGMITFPAYAENGSQQVLLPYINTKIYHRPPLWAESFEFLFTREPSSYLYWETPSVNDAETEYIYFEVTNILLNQTINPTTAAVLSYTFADGDRLRLIRKVSDDTVYPDTYDTAILGLLVNPTINGVAQTGKQFLKINKIAPFDTVDYSTDNFVIEMYRPAQQQATGINKTYYNFGVTYPILNAGTSNRVHAGQVTNQSTNLATPAEFNFYAGDSYFRLRGIPLEAATVGLAEFYVLDRNFVDFYISAVSSLDGTPSVIDPNAREIFLPATIRFSLAFQYNTDINGLNRFRFENFIDLDRSYGTIMRIKVRQREMHTFQELKTGSVPLFYQIRKDDTGNNIEVVTDKLLNPVQYYAGDWGIGTASESLASFNYSDYFCDNNKGVILRLSKDGLTPLSIIANINNWASNEVTARTGDYKIYGTFNQKANSCIWALEETEDYPAKTIVFNEDANNFESFLSMHPQTMCCLGTTLVTCFEGNLYTHDGDTYNNFYGVAYPSSVTLVFNDKSMVKKTFNAIGYQSNEKWISNTKGDIYTSNINPQTGLRTQSKLVAADYELQENVTVAAFQRDMNSMSNERVALFEGDYLKGVYIATKLICPSDKANKLVYLNQIYTTNSISQKNF